MRTLGIDLASHGGSTGVWEIDWDSDESRVEVGKQSDNDLADRIRDVRGDGGWTAVDAPFGFPVTFTQAVVNWSTRRTVTLTEDDDDDLRRRLTDRYVQRRQELLKKLIKGGWNTWPLSSVVDLITPRGRYQHHQ